ncbi:MAG: NAD(P)-binding domain-containing protein [Anaerolineae bacterium]|nr:NAD(P)-binding domain-containing protein [Anaerolineae bacterium]
MNTNSLSNKRFAIIGVGNIGRILITRLLAAGVPAGQIVICDADVARGQASAAEFGVTAVTLTDEAACTADLILLSPAPQAVPAVLQSLSPRLRQGQVVVSFAALISLARLENIAPPGVAVVRVMPNAPSLVGAGLNPVAYGATATQETRELVTAVLATLGDSIEVQDEQMNWCVGLSGAAMRSLLPVLEGMAQSGEAAGLSPAAARRVAAQVMAGTAVLVLNTDLSFSEMKALTPMQTVDETAVTQLFYDAARSAKDKMDAIQLKLEGGVR